MFFFNRKPNMKPEQLYNLTFQFPKKFSTKKILRYFNKLKKYSVDEYKGVEARKLFPIFSIQDRLNHGRINHDAELLCRPKHLKKVQKILKKCLVHGIDDVTQFIHHSWESSMQRQHRDHVRTLALEDAWALEKTPSLSACPRCDEAEFDMEHGECEHCGHDILQYMYNIDKMTDNMVKKGKTKVIKAA